MCKSDFWRLKGNANFSLCNVCYVYCFKQLPLQQDTWLISSIRQWIFLNVFILQLHIGLVIRVAMGEVPIF